MNLKVRRDKKGVALFETTNDRFNFLFGFILFMVAVIVYTGTFAWLPYWLFTGKNLFKETLKAT